MEPRCGSKAWVLSFGEAGEAGGLSQVQGQPRLPGKLCNKKSSYLSMRVIPALGRLREDKTNLGVTTSVMPHGSTVTIFSLCTGSIRP